MAALLEPRKHPSPPWSIRRHPGVETAGGAPQRDNGVDPGRAPKESLSGRSIPGYRGVDLLPRLPLKSRCAWCRAYAGAFRALETLWVKSPGTHAPQNKPRPLAELDDVAARISHTRNSPLPIASPTSGTRLICLPMTTGSHSPVAQPHPKSAPQKNDPGWVTTNGLKSCTFYYATAANPRTAPTR